MSMMLPGIAKFNALAAGATHAGDTAGSVKTMPFIIDGKKASILVVWTGTTSGTVTFYTSENWDTTPAALAADKWNGTWNSINGLLSPAITQPSGSAGSYELSTGTYVARYLYVDYARSAGSGTITVTYAVSSD